MKMSYNGARSQNCFTHHIEPNDREMERTVKRVTKEMKRERDNETENITENN
jgi:hypothetical protein